jgi:hypothetical protein
MPVANGAAGSTLKQKARKPQKPTPKQIQCKNDALKRARKTKKKIAALVTDGRFSDGEKDLAVGLIASEILAAQGITKFSISELT